MAYGAPQVRLGGTWTKTIAWLTGVQVVIFLAQAFSPGPVPHGPDQLSLLFGITAGDVFPARLYTLLTYSFLHNPRGIGHLLFNMLTLYFFGGDLQLFLGLRRFWVLYLGSALAGGIAAAFMPPGTLIIGASGAIFGLMAAFAVYFPRTKLLFFFIFPIPVRIAVALLAALSVFFLAVGSGGNIAHLAHLGGGLFGLAFSLRIWNFSKLISDLKYRWRRRHFRRIQ